MGGITNDDRCLITGLRTEKNWGAFVLQGNVVTQ